MNIYCKNLFMQEKKELGVEGERKQLNKGAPSNVQTNPAVNS
jgi:hypothetical protein